MGNTKRSIQPRSVVAGAPLIKPNKQSYFMNNESETSGDIEVYNAHYERDRISGRRTLRMSDMQARSREGEPWRTTNSVASSSKLAARETSVGQEWTVETVKGISATGSRCQREGRMGIRSLLPTTPLSPHYGKRETLLDETKAFL